MATIMRDGNWTKFGQGRWHYTPPYMGPKNELRPYRGPPVTQIPHRDLRDTPSRGPGGVLPGPGPSAGGRYRWQGVNPNPGVPTTWKQAWRMGQAWQLGRKAMRLNPVGRAVDLGFTLLDLWQVTDPADPNRTWDFEGTGWRMKCSVPNPIWQVGTRTTSDPNLWCDLPGQLFQWDVPGPGVNLNTPPDIRWFAFGPKTGLHPVYRMTLHTQWTRNNPPPAQIPWLGPKPATVQPMPHNLAPPAPWPDPYGPPSRQRHRREDPRRRTRPSSRVRVRTKPAPYQPVPPYTPVKTLPRPGEEKRVIRDPWIGDFYGKLTEVKDALKCIEKNTKGYRPQGGLFTRMANLSGHIYRNPHSVDWRGVGSCLVANQIEDAVIGKVNQLANQITKSPYWKRPFGVGRGGFSVRMN